MNPELKIYVDRLQGGNTEAVELELNPTFIEVDEPDLKFRDKVFIEGKAYLANDHLVIQLSVETKTAIPCAICNEPASQTIKIECFYHAEELSEIKGKVYDYSQPLREAILLEVPSFAECKGNCPKRNELNKYFHADEQEGPNCPFADLN